MELRHSCGDIDDAFVERDRRRKRNEPNWRRAEPVATPAPRTSNSLPGGHSEREPPDPIPNSEVKTLCADGSVPFRHARVGHCQALILRTPEVERPRGFLVVSAWRPYPPAASIAAGPPAGLHWTSAAPPGAPPARENARRGPPGPCAAAALHRAAAASARRTAHLESDRRHPGSRAP